MPAWPMVTIEGSAGGPAGTSSPPAPHPASAAMIRSRPFSTAIAACLALVVAAGRPRAADLSPAPDYQRDVQPILAEHCGHCHGVDEQSRKGDLRLDVRERAIEGGESGQAAIVPGRPDESELVNRIRSADPDTIMPPPHEKKPLTPAQIKTLEAWIASGATYAQCRA